MLIKLFLPAVALLSPAPCLAFQPKPSLLPHTLKNQKIYSTSDAAAKSQYSKVFVAGGTNGVGRLVVEKLAANGSSVVTIGRNPESISELNNLEGVTAISADALDYKAVEGAMDGCDACISLLGRGPDSKDEIRVDYPGNSNVIEAAGILGVTRVILVTSIGCGSSKEALPPAVYETLKDALLAKSKAENMLKKYYTNTNWTIVRPGGLKSEPATGTACLTEDTLCIGSICREDVAELVVSSLTSAKTERKVLHAIDPANQGVEGRAVQEFSL